MGNTNTACCDHSGFHQIPQSASIDTLKQYQITQEPKISNPIIQQTLSKFKEPIDSDIILNPNRQLRPPMKNKKHGHIYIGEWLNQKPDGVGKLILKNGQYFEGEFQQGQAIGPGRYIRINGEYYQGNIRKNKANGQGIFVSKDVEFIGKWQDSLPMQGSYKFHNGIVADIRLQDNKRIGIITWPNKDVYEGEIKGYNPHGYGVMRFSDGKLYEGQWENGLMHGQGKYKWVDGTRYKGQYRLGKKQGQGTFYYKSGKIYDGQWRNGKQHGKGKLIYDNIVIDESEWIDGIPVSQS